MKRLIIFFCILVSACADKKELEIKPARSIAGTANYKDLGNTQKPLVNQKVYIRKTNSADAMRETYTDKDGKFLFTNLEDLTYNIYTQPTVQIFENASAKLNGVLENVSFNSLNVVLTATYDPGADKGLMVITTDSLGGKLPDSDIFVYTSSVLASVDTGYTGQGTLYQKKSNSKGMFLFLALPMDTLFIKSHYKIGTSAKLKSKIEKFWPQPGIDSLALQLK